MSGAVHSVENTVHSIGNAFSNPSNLLGTALGFGVGGAGGLTGGNLAGNVATGQPLGTNLGGAVGGDLLGLGAGAGLAGAMAPDPFAGYTVDPMTGDVIPAGNAAGAAGGGALGSGAASGTGSILGKFLGGALGGAGGGNAIQNFLTGQGGGASLPSLAPGLAALAYAAKQTPVDTSQLQNVYNQAGANAPAFIQAAQSPLQQAQAGGYGDLLQSQASRGIRGSSFGDQDIANYMNTTNQGIANAGTNAAEAALGLQGSLAGQISNLNALSQQMKNNLYGRAFSSLGQGLSPTPGIGGYGGGGGGIPGMGGGASSLLGNLGVGGVGSAIGNGLGSIGSGLGNIFGSPGSSIWGTGTVPFLQNSGLDSIALAGGFGAGF